MTKEDQLLNKSEIIRRARLYGTPVQEQNAEVEYRFTLEELGLLLSTACVIEREACAKLVENFAIDMDDEWVCGKAAEAIRARGQE